LGDANELFSVHPPTLGTWQGCSRTGSWLLPWHRSVLSGLYL